MTNEKLICFKIYKLNLSYKIKCLNFENIYNNLPVKIKKFVACGFNPVVQYNIQQPKKGPITFKGISLTILDK